MINIIDARKASVIINEFEPMGLYMIIQCVNGYDYYTGIDNSTGDAWTEDFKTFAECFAWLKHENWED